MVRFLPALLLLGLPASALATPAGNFIDRFRAVSKAAMERAIKAYGNTQAAVTAVVEDPELAPLLKELFDATGRYRLQVEASEKAGRPRACLPRTVTTSFDA